MQINEYAGVTQFDKKDLVILVWIFEVDKCALIC